MEALCRYYDRLYDELVKLFKECPKAAECFPGGGGAYVFSGRDWNAGEYWRITLSERIKYPDGIVLAQQTMKELGPFHLHLGK